MNLRDFRIGWGLLAKEPAYSVVVTMGLAVGIAACFLLLGLVRHSSSYDQQVPEHERIYRLMQYWNVSSFGNQWRETASTAARDAALGSGQPLLATSFDQRAFDIRAADQVR